MCLLAYELWLRSPMTPSGMSRTTLPQALCQGDQSAGPTSTESLGQVKMAIGHNSGDWRKISLNFQSSRSQSPFTPQ